MSEEILINVTPQETRIGVVENGMLQELLIERSKNRGLVGNIYKGKVKRVLPGMQAAFVDIGLERSAFLHVSEILPQHDNGDKDDVPQPDITRLLHEGQKIIVQVIKDELGTKGARLTTHITVPSRYLVLMPRNPHVGVSQRIENEEERNRLRDILNDEEQDNKGYIIRTAAEGAGEAELQHDADFLQKLWQRIEDKLKKAKCPSLVHEDLSLELRMMRDLVVADVEKIRVDSQESFQRISQFVAEFAPSLKGRLEHYQRGRPLFDVYNIEDEIQKALHRQVPLKSGGYLIIDQTEAMTTVDVNTGAFVGHRNLEETIFRTNLEAASALARQLRLRNLGGIIIVDFIDMKDEEHKRQVLRTLEKSLEHDHAKTHISEVSALGLVQMTRKRTRESLEHVLCEPCPTCSGRGSIKTAQTVCYDIFREIARAARAYEAPKLLVLASQEVVDCLLDDEASSVAELESFINIPIRFQVETLYTQEQFDVVLL
ncbi:ribonuclease G [Pleionea sp. CnH1-48]|uniref:ribonuclease G n=1 Tax=Pleionea sp. CnH1-48 TaxID=2954494 RepID=UPI002096B372|nr:ribonuclease G [Pleionea sp. CnH1-48]MCO7224058.1 ribonuclease G [Pleionea sp. CnH1-48]